MTFPERSNFSSPPLLTHDSESLLTRDTLTQTPTLTPLQSQVDGLVGGFAQQVTDWRSLAAMAAGGLAYRAARVGVMSSGLRGSQILSVGLGLGAEVATFEMSQRSLTSLTGESSLNPNLWRWEGQGGIRQGLLSSLVTFGSLKGAGRLAQGENLVVQHLLQDTGMVLGHQISGAFEITARPQGSLAEQFLHAEATNLQLSAGMALGHSFSGGRIAALERGLDLSLGSVSLGIRNFEPPEGLQPAFALEGAESSISDPGLSDPVSGSWIMQMTGPKGERGRRSSKDRAQGTISSSTSRGPETESRQRVRRELESVTQELEALYNESENCLEGMRILLRQTNRKNAEHWEIYDRLLLRHSFISRKHQIGATALVPGGGAEKWPIARLEGAIPSLRRALVESRSFFESLRLPDLPSVPLRPTGFRAKSWEEIIRMFRQLGRNTLMTPHLLRRIIPKGRRNNTMVLMGLEGLHGLINERPKDECQAVTGLLESILNGNGSGFEMLQQLLVLTMNFQTGLISRSEIMGVIREARDFHQAYPEARGPFLELFTRRLLLGSREAMLVVPLLNFARHHLDQNESVTLEPRSSIHQGILTTESPSGDAFRYAAVGILKEVNSYHQLEFFAEKMAAELVKAWEAEPKKTLRQGIYIEISRLDHDVEPERLRFWGRMALERAVPLALEEVIKMDTSLLLDRYTADEAKRSFSTMSTEKLRLYLNEIFPGLGNSYKLETEPVRDLRLQLEGMIRQYWNAFNITLDRMDISYGSNPRHLQILHVGAEDPSSEDMISQLRTDIEGMSPQDPALPRKHLLLAHLLNDMGRKNEAVELLRSQLNGQPHKRIREFYRDLFQDALEEIFPSASSRSHTNYPIESKQILEFLSVFFDTDLKPESLEKILQIQHPKFEFGAVKADRNGDALRIILPVLKVNSFGSENIGEFLLDLNLPKNESKLIAQLSRAHIFPDDRGQAAGVFVMDRIFHLLQALKITELRVEADDTGKYAWLRMGGEFLRDEDRVRAANVLHVAEVALPPGYTVRIAPTPLIAELLASLPRREREEVLSSWPGSPIYRWSLLPGSPEMGRFRQYLSEKQKTSWPWGLLH